MAIITKPVGGISKGVPAEITLNKSELAALSSVSSDAYFSLTTNWNKIILSYKSSEGNQQEIVEFDATLSPCLGFFDVSTTARNLFEIQVIKIIDFDGGIFIIPRSSLTTADFDIDFEGTTPPFSGTYIDWTERDFYTPQADGGITSTLIGPDSSVASLIYGDNTRKNPNDGSFNLIYKLNKTDFINQDYRFLGITEFGKHTYTGFVKDVSVGPNGITILRQNSSLGNFTIDAFSDPEVTEFILKMTITDDSVEYFVNGLKITELVGTSIFASSGEMIPAARVYDGMEVLESYFE